MKGSYIADEIIRDYKIEQYYKKKAEKKKKLKNIKGGKEDESKSNK